MNPAIGRKQYTKSLITSIFLIFSWFLHLGWESRRTVLRYSKRSTWEGEKLLLIIRLISFLLLICLHDAYAVIDDNKISFQDPVTPVKVLKICHLKGTCVGGASDLHVGTDYSPNPDKYNETPVYAVNFGVLKQYIDYDQDVGCKSKSCTMGNIVVMEHVFTTGEKWLSLYAHLASKDIDNSIGNRVSKNQKIGIIGCSGSTPTQWCNTNGRNKHNHFEIKKPGLGSSDLWPYGYMNQAEANTLRTSTEKQLATDLAIGSAIDRVFSQVETLQKQKAKILLPFFGKEPNPSMENYEVFGTNEKLLYTSISLTPVTEATFTNIGVGGTLYADENNIQDIFINPKESFFANQAKILTGSKVLPKGDYKFYAYSTQFGQGYSLKFSILEQNSKIIDNDSREGFNKDEASDFLEVPGYYLSAYLFPTQPKTIKYAKWVPKLNPGKYEIFVHIPRMATAITVRYKIYPYGKSNSPFILSNPINHYKDNDSWVKITATNQENWEFNEEGFVGLSMGNSGSGDDGGNTEIPIKQQFVGVDAVKFIYVGDPTPAENVNKEKDDTQIKSLNKEKGDIQIINTGLNNPIHISVDGKEIQGQQTSDGMTFNLYQATSTNFDTFRQPIKLDILDAKGQTIYSACFPFKDVCPATWYAAPIMKLWKENLLQSDNEGLFKPNELCEKDDSSFCLEVPIQRIEAVVTVLSAFPDKFQKTLTGFKHGQQPLESFLDVTDPNTEHFPYVYAAQAEGLIGGYPDRTFKPEQPMTRAEMAKLICTATYGPEECIEKGKMPIIPPDQEASPVCSPTVSSVSPLTATLNQLTTFTVTGQCLPDTTGFWIDQCNNVSPLSGNTEQNLKFSCIPSGSGGPKSGKTQANGNTLKDFTIDVQVPQPVCSPAVSSVSPTSATLNQSTTFTITGQCLPDTTAFWIDQCSNVTSLGGNAQSRQFSCTPSYSGGTKSGLIKTQANGDTLKNFTLDVQVPQPVCSPAVSSVSPLSATLNQTTTFTVTGQCLPDTTAFWIDQCSNVSSLGGNAQSRQFSCTPSYSGGTKSGIVKDRPNGTVLKNFNLTVPEPQPVCTKPSVSSVSPASAKLNQSTVFTVMGQCLPDTTAFWIDQCTNVVSRSGGNSQTRTFECTPSYTKGIKSGVVKDRSGGTELTKFTVTVQ